MKVRAKLGLFALVLATTFGGAFAVGRAVGPIEDTPATDEPQPRVEDDGMHGAGVADPTEGEGEPGATQVEGGH